MPKGFCGFQKGNTLWNNPNAIKNRFQKGYKHTKEFKLLISEIHKNKVVPLKTRKRMSESHLIRRSKHWNWKGGIYDDIAKYMKEKRHHLGINKEYRSKYTGISYTKEYKRLHRKIYKYHKKNGGPLTIQIIQQVYEENIKKYGTLTCYLCLDSILFGNDHLEHKTPLSRGGTNIRDNLDIACQRCNCKKHNKTEEEFRKEFAHVRKVYRTRPIVVNRI